MSCKKSLTPCAALIIFCLFTFFDLHAQLCSPKYFGKSYTEDGYGYQHFFLQMPDKGFIMGGNVNGKLLIVKVDAEGNMLWNKKYDPDTYFYQGYTMKAILGQDNMIYCMAANNYLLKLDGNGNVIWTKKIVIPDRGALEFRNFALLANGDFAFLFKDYEYFVTRIKADASTVVWSKSFSSYYSFYDNIAADDNRIIVTGTFQNTGRIIGINAADGSMDADRSFTVNGEEVIAYKVYPHAGGYFIDAINITSLNPPHKRLLLKLDKSLNFQSVHAFAGIPADENTSYVIEPDGSYYIAWGSGIPNLLYASKSNKVLWSRRNYSIFFSNTYNLIKTPEGLVVSSGGSNMYAVAEQKYFWFYAITKTDFNGRIEGCGSTEVPVTINPISLELKDLTITLNNFSDFAIETATAATIPLNIKESSSACYYQSICGSVSVNGPATYCGNTSVNYTASRNFGCSLPVTWNLIGSEAEMTRLSDSSISVQFIQNGNYRLAATITSDCYTISDTIDIAVTVSDQLSLELGPNQEICPGNSVILDAGAQFNSYKWQNNSVQQTFTATAPGTYYVEAKDACNNLYKDTVTINAAPPVSINIGNDLQKCNNDTLTITAPDGFMNYSWSPQVNIIGNNTKQIQVFPNSTVEYHLIAEKSPGCVAKDSIWVTVNHSLAFNLGSDTAICSGDSVTLKAPPGFVSYQWNNNSSDPVIKLGERGMYILTATDQNGCRSIDTFQLTSVYDLPLITLDKRSYLCEGTERILDGGAGFKSYQWNSGEQTRQISVSAPGVYKITVQNNEGCTAHDSTVITTVSANPSGFLPADTSICQYGKIDLAPMGTFAEYSWNTGQNSRTISINRSGMYTLEVKDERGCKGSDDILVAEVECLEGFVAPNAFTPNGDGKNDEFKPMLFGKISSYKLVIFNRWGQKVFETVDINKGWNGSINGAPQFNNHFVWNCSYQLEGQQLKTEKGIVVPVK